MQKLKKNKKTIITVVIAVIISVFISVTSCYVLAETLMDSKDVYYKDNSSLGFNNVQDAIDGTCTKFSDEVASLREDIKKDILNETYPIGSIYISTSMTTAEQVNTVIGGKWEAYGSDKVLRGTTTKAEVTGGSDTVTLTTDNLPSHNHSFTPAGSVASTFKGTAVNSGTQSANHTHTFSGTTVGSGGHSHTVGFQDDKRIVNGHMQFAINLSGGTHSVVPSGISTGNTSSVGNHTHTYSGTTAANNVSHYHSVTAAGTVTSTFTGTTGNTGATGGGKSFSVQNSYITVFMYKRIS